jgi:SAM-dependent methyltransferase
VNDQESLARQQAMAQWNRTPCGQLEGDKHTLDYFLAVEQSRYLQQPWQHRYFRFADWNGKSVLEIGVGHGTDLIQFAKGGARCHGVDITESHLQLTERNFALRGFDVDLRRTDATVLPFEDNSIDCVYSFGVIHHIPDAPAVIREIRRVLRPGGTLLIALYYKWSAFSLFNKFLRDGLVRGWLFSKGYQGLLATIEQGADGVNIKPYVALYDVGDTRQLLRDFRIEDCSIHQLVPNHFGLPFFGATPGPVSRLLEHRLGWYVAARAVKP